MNSRLTSLCSARGHNFDAFVDQHRPSERRVQLTRCGNNYYTGHLRADRAVSETGCRTTISAEPLLHVCIQVLRTTTSRKALQQSGLRTRGGCRYRAHSKLHSPQAMIHARESNAAGISSGCFKVEQVCMQQRRQTCEWIELEAYLHAAASRSGQRASDHGVTCRLSSTVNANAMAASPISSVTSRPASPPPPRRRSGTTRWPFRALIPTR